MNARFSEQQAAVIKTANGSTTVLRAVADAILAGGEIQIVSGEGERGTVAVYAGKRSLPAIKRRLAAERCGGDRWARAQVYCHVHPTGPVYIDVERGTLR